MMNWGFSIKKLRQEAGLTQEELAERASLTRTHISRIELGAFYGWKQDTFQQLADGLSMSPSELAEVIYGDNGNNNKSTVSVITDIRRKLKFLENELKDSK